MTGESNMLELERLYLMTIAKMVEAHDYAAVLQQVQPGKGRLYFIRPGTTRADAVLGFEFQDAVFAVTIWTQLNEQGGERYQFHYIEGIDNLLPALSRALVGNRLPAPGQTTKAKKGNLANPVARAN